MDDEEDVKRITEVLNCTKKENLQEFEYEDFINCEESDAENEEIASDIDDYLLYDISNTDISKLHSYDPRSTLKPEERVAIDSCSDPELKNLLLLNRSKNMKLMQLYKQMKDLLIECQKNIMEKSEIIKAYVASNKGQTSSTGAWRLAAPYFKDKQLFPSPPNDDVFKKKNNNELSVYDLSSTPKWSSFECEKLIRAVKLNYNINQQNDVMKKIEDVQNSTQENEELLTDLHARLEELRVNDSEVPPLNSDEYVDWMRVAEVFLKDKHSALECRSFWHIYLHPCINKSSWTPTETEELKELVKQYNYQNWNQIAEELHTNRTGFTVCMYYYSNVHEKCKRGDFTFEEDARLLDLVYQYRMGSYIPWVKIVQHFKDRTRSQLHSRYTYYLSQNNKRKGKFSDAEDVLLMILVDKFGRNFKKCSEYLPTRSMVQCKARYNTNLQMFLKKGSFGLVEDEIIMKHAEKYGTKSWANLTEKLQRSRGQIRQRYQTLKQFMESNPENPSLINAPRRKHNLKFEEDSFDFLRVIADQYRNCSEIPSLDEIEKIVADLRPNTKKNKPIDSGAAIAEEEEEEGGRVDIPFPISSSGVDDMLTDFFCNSYKLNISKVIPPINLQKAVTDVEKVLNALKVDLFIPKNFEENNKLDTVDVAIISSLLEKNPMGTDCSILRYKSGTADITDLIAPNLNTVVGLRSLLIKFSRYKFEESSEMRSFILGAKKQRWVSGFRTTVINQLLHLPPETGRKIEIERKLFYRRFHALYKWPAIMTLENPSAELLSTTRLCNNTIPFQVKRTYSRADRNNSVNGSVKRMKISELPKTSQNAVPLKLTPVTNKSVIEDLMRNKNKKLFYLNNIKCGHETKTIIKEVPFSNITKPSALCGPGSVNNDKWRALANSSATTSNAESSSSRESNQINMEGDDCTVADVGERISNASCSSTEDDEEDVKKLKLFLSQKHEKEDDELEDLKNFDIFLKREEELDYESDGHSSLFE